jgi:ArsR family transcriptional regulator, arsenate/arsenite/antimonite-responsive transcriptional repressor
LQYYNIDILGTTKKENFTKKQNELAVIAKAIGHPARIAILEYLSKINDCICSDIVDKINLSQPTVSQHLRELKSAGLIKGTIDGNSICYCIEEKTITNLKLFLDKISSQTNTTNCCS